MADNTTSLHQAVQSALATWLASTPAGLTDHTVSQRWPDAGPPLPTRAITVLRAGAPQIDYFDEDQIASVQVGTSKNYTYMFTCGQVELPMQLDVWTQSDAARDDSVARIDLALHASKALTLAAFLAAQGNTLTQPAFEADLVVQCAPPWDNCLAGFALDAAPSIDDSPAGAKRREYRATYRLTAFYDLVYTTVQPILSMVVVREWATTGCNLTAPAGGINHILTVTPSGSSQSDGT